MNSLIRRGRFQDIPRLVELMSDAHARSIYDDQPVDMKLFKELVFEGLRSGNQEIFIAEIDGRAEGFLLGLTDRLYHICRNRYATDLFFIVSDAGRGAAPGLIDAFCAWAKKQPRVVEIWLGVTTAISDPERVGKLYRRKGFAISGNIYQQRIEP